MCTSMIRCFYYNDCFISKTANKYVDSDTNLPHLIYKALMLICTVQFSHFTVVQLFLNVE